MKSLRARATRTSARTSASPLVRSGAPWTQPAAPLVRSFIVLGAEPQVGQTCVTAALLRTLGEQGVNAVGMKPVARGIVTAGGDWQSDELLQLAAASAFGLPARALCAHLQRDGGADGASAQADDTPPTLDAVLDTFRVLSTWADTLVVDCATGAPFGGLALTRKLGLPFVYVVRVPVDGAGDAGRTADRGDTADMADPANTVNADNAAVQQVMALVAPGAECAGWIAVASTADRAPDTTSPVLAALQQRMPGPCLGVFVCGSNSATLDLPRTLRAPAA